METAHTLNIANGATVAYKRWRSLGGATHPPLVLIHGAASNMTRWSEFVENTTLKATRDILRVDLRGHGQSRYRGRMNLEVWADDLAAILRQENISQAIVGGHCLGANVSVVFAARHPARTAGLVLVEPMLRPALTGALRKLVPFAPLFKTATAALHLGYRVGLHRREIETIDLRELDREFRQRLAQPGGGAALVKRYASPLHDLKIMPTANFLINLMEVTRPLPLASLASPFLALLSTGRTFSDPHITQTLLASLKHGTLVTLDAKHWIPTEQPEAMRTAIEAWCNNLVQ